MLIWSTVNPEGEHETYQGFYLNQRDIDDCVAHNKLVGCPVKIEHKGAAIGNVVSAWKSGSKLDCLMDIDDDMFRSQVVQEYIRQGRVSECSLGYKVNFQASASRGARTTHKEFVEVSLVKKGDRPKCKIHSFTID